MHLQVLTARQGDSLFIYRKLVGDFLSEAVFSFKLPMHPPGHDVVGDLYRKHFPVLKDSMLKGVVTAIKRQNPVFINLDNHRPPEYPPAYAMIFFC